MGASPRLRRATRRSGREDQDLGLDDPRGHVPRRAREPAGARNRPMGGPSCGLETAAGWICRSSHPQPAAGFCSGTSEASPRERPRSRTMPSISRARCPGTSDVFPYAWLWQELGATEGPPWLGRAYTIAIEPATSFPATGSAASSRPVPPTASLRPGNPQTRGSAFAFRPFDRRQPRSPQARDRPHPAYRRRHRHEDAHRARRDATRNTIP